MLVSLGLVALAAIAAVITTTAVVVTQKREAVESAQALDRYKLEAGEKISAANEATAKLEADNLALRQAISLRRHLSDPQNVEFLRRLDTNGIRIYVGQTADGDSMALNGEIFSVLSAPPLNWTPSAGATQEWQIFKPGIEVWTPDPNSLGILAFPANHEIAARAWSIGEAIVRWLKMQGIHFVVHRTAPQPNLPRTKPPNVLLLAYGVTINAVHVLVGDRNIDGEAEILREKRADTK
jgi:hypothetical protein